MLTVLALASPGTPVVGLLSMVGAGCLGAVLMLLVLGFAVTCYVCKERRNRSFLRDKETGIFKRRTNNTTAIRGQK